MDVFQEKLIALRHAFHRDPEHGIQERRTKVKVATILRELGLEIHEWADVVGILLIGAALWTQLVRNRLPVRKQKL